MLLLLANVVAVSLICSGIWACYIMLGISNGAVTVFIPQIRKEANSTDAVTEEMASWLPAFNAFSAIPWMIIFPITIQKIGRRWTYTLMCAGSFIGFVVLYVSTNITQIVISEVLITGVNGGGHYAVSILITTEYTTPKYRGLFLTITMSTFFWGVWAANAIGTFFHWKNIAIVGIACAVYSLLIVFIMPESPYWLATKRRFDECAKSHRWLMGKDKQAEIGLHDLIDFQKPQDVYNKSKKFAPKNFLIKYFKIMTKKQFVKPVIFSFLLFGLHVCSGKVACSLYAIDVIGKMTNDYESAAYVGMLILDGATVFSMYIGCIIAKILPRRQMLIGASIIGIIFSFTISLYLFLCKLDVIVQNNYITITILTCYSIAVSVGPMILISTISGEMIAIEARTLSVFCIAITYTVMHGSLLKLTPSLYETFDLHGTFLFYGVMSSFFLCLIYKFLPETKDKTLQEIADCMKGLKNNLKPKENVELLPTSVKD